MSNDVRRIGSFAVLGPQLEHMAERVMSRPEPDSKVPGAIKSLR